MDQARWLDADATAGVLKEPTDHRPRLVAVWGEGVATFRLPEKGSVVIGRASDVDFRIDALSVSRRHAVLYIAPTRDGDACVLRLEDLGSSNGTRVGGRVLPPRTPTAIGPDDAIVLGQASLLVHWKQPGVGGSIPPDPLEDDSMATTGEVPVVDTGLQREIDAFERERILLALQRCGGNQTLAATTLGISRRTLVRRLGAWGATRPRAQR